MARRKGDSELVPERELKLDISTAKPSSAYVLPKISSGIQGLDEVLRGGYPKDRSTLIIGGPGTGKTILGLEFIYQNALLGIPGIFVSFEESQDSIRKNAKTLGWDFETLEKKGLLRLISGKTPSDAIIGGDFNFKGMIAIIDGQVKQINARLIVVDALDVLVRILDDPLRERNEIFGLHDWMRENKLTSILTLKPQDSSGLSRYSFLEYLVDCVLVMDQRITNQLNTRRLRVLKYRGSSYGSNEYPYVILADGIRFIPLTNVTLQHIPIGPAVSTGQERLDKILGGGIMKSSVFLFSGPSGSGKTSLACTFAKAAADRGERVLYVSFEESRESLVTSMLSPGIDLASSLNNGLLTIESRLPEACGAEQHLIEIFDSIDRIKPDHVIFEAISSCLRLGNPEIVLTFITRLTDHCRSHGVTCILTNQVSSVFKESEMSGVGFSSMVDGALILNYIDAIGEVNRTLLVLKSRGMGHSNQYWEYKITGHGIEINDAYVGEGEVLTGIQRLRQEARDALLERQRMQRFEQFEREIERLKAYRDAQIVSMQNDIKNKEIELETLRSELGIQQQSSEEQKALREMENHRAKRRIA